MLSHRVTGCCSPGVIGSFVAVTAGYYHITAYGAQGGNSFFSVASGGFGAEAMATFSLTAQEKLTVFVGGRGQSATVTGGGGAENNYSGGGGGSFDAGVNQTLVAGQNGGNGSVVITFLGAPTVITGTQANQATGDETLIRPFGTVTLTDASAAGTIETLTVTPSSTGAGTLSDPSNPSTVASNGTVALTAAAVQSELRGLVFTPVAGDVLDLRAALAAATWNHCTTLREASSVNKHGSRYEPAPQSASELR